MTGEANGADVLEPTRYGWVMCKVCQNVWMAVWSEFIPLSRVECDLCKHNGVDEVEWTGPGKPEFQ